MLSEDRYVLETPENVEVEFELAGLGSRFCAILIDTLWIVLLVFLLFLLLLLFGIGMLEGNVPGSQRLAQWLVAAIWIITAVLIFNGYFIFFEVMMRGQTPGKKSMKIRVVRDDGTPVGVNEVLIRNLLRLVDFLPAFYAVGSIMIFISPLCKRLGDMAAGTIVVKEGRLDYRANADKKYELSPAAIGAVNAELTPEERRVLLGFLRRREELLPAARSQLAERLARPLHEKYGGEFGDAEDYIERLAEGRCYEP
jgi:uncharacterized RDD family membrane protein YckC